MPPSALRRGHGDGAVPGACPGGQGSAAFPTGRNAADDRLLGCAHAQPAVLGPSGPGGCSGENVRLGHHDDVLCLRLRPRVRVVLGVIIMMTPIITGIQGTT